MIITPRDQRVLEALARDPILDRRRVQKQVFPNDADGRVTRRRLEALAEAGYIRRHTMLVVSSHDGPQAPVYLLTTKGCQYLADKLGDATFLHKPVDPPHPLQLVHALAIADFHILFDAAIIGQTDVTLEAWHNEADVVNGSEPDTDQHFRLRTKFDNKITCLPDAGFLLNHGGQRTAFYLELERGDGDSGTGSRQLVERKGPGYVELARQRIHLKHFPGADEFRVLLVVPHAARRDAVRHAFEKKDAAKYRTDLWRFLALTDITADTLLNNEICYRCGSESAERLTPTAGVRPGSPLPDAPDGPQGRESPNAAGPDAEPAALLARAAPAGEETEERSLSSAAIRTNTASEVRD